MVTNTQEIPVEDRHRARAALIAERSRETETLLRQRSDIEAQTLRAKAQLNQAKLQLAEADAATTELKNRVRTIDAQLSAVEEASRREMIQLAPAELIDLDSRLIRLIETTRSGFLATASGHNGAKVAAKVDALRRLRTEVETLILGVDSASDLDSGLAGIESKIRDLAI